MMDYEINDVLKVPLIELMSHSANLFYIVDENLNIIYLNTNHWNKFAIDNGYKPIPDDQFEEQFIGKSILDFFKGNKTLNLWKRIFKYSIDNIKEIDIPFKCPSPEIMRFGLMEVIPFQAPSSSGSDVMKTFLVVRSLIYHEKDQPEMKIYDLNSDIRKDVAFITICSFCRLIHSEEDDTWIEGQEYYRRGGTNNVNISHGICNDCLDKIETKLN